MLKELKPKVETAGIRQCQCQCSGIHLEFAREII